MQFDFQLKIGSGTPTSTSPSPNMNSQTKQNVILFCLFQNLYMFGLITNYMSKIYCSPSITSTFISTAVMEYEYFCNVFIPSISLYFIIPSQLLCDNFVTSDHWFENIYPTLPDKCFAAKMWMSWKVLHSLHDDLTNYYPNFYRKNTSLSNDCLRTKKKHFVQKLF